MNTFTRSLCLLVAGICSPTTLTSCYFNTAEHLFDAGSHNAVITTGDIKPGASVYKSPSGHYYVEVPRYRYDTEITTLSMIADQERKSKEVSYSKGDYAIVRIPEDIAMCLIGQRTTCVWPPELEPTKYERDFLRKCTAYTIDTPLPAKTKEYKYVSPNVAWWYLLGALDWVCVDLPVSCALSLTLGTVSVIGALDKANKEAASSGGYNYGEGSDPNAMRQETERMNMLNDAANRANGR